MMNNSDNFQFDDLQALLRYSHGKLTDTCFLLLNVSDSVKAKKWLESAPILNAMKLDIPPETALQIAFSVEGLRSLGVDESVIAGFSDEYIMGMSGEESRSRRLGDTGENAPKEWDWGGKTKELPHVLLMLYAKKDGIKHWRDSVEGESFLEAFRLIKALPTLYIGDIEPFGFKDGISQPVVDWESKQSTDSHAREAYSNLVAVGEVVLGYPNEYGLYTPRPLINASIDSFAKDLPSAEEDPKLKDFGRNGSYLVVRQLAQDVPAFWQFLYKVSDQDMDKCEHLAEAMVGRTRDGKPLVPKDTKPIPGISTQNKENHFSYDFDQKGYLSPIGSHVRRANPRTGDLPPRVTGFMGRLMSKLGFSQKQEEDLVASTRFHRILRRGRSYGPLLSPKDAIKSNAKVEERGLQFMCLSANILRQFEFVQSAWSMSSKFSGLQNESDPLLGNREALMNGEKTDQFNRPKAKGVTEKVVDLPKFVTVKGGGYFFMPGLRAVKYIASLPVKEEK